MKIYYDKETDSAYIELSTAKPDGVVEISEGVNLDTTKEGKLIGIELLNASDKISLQSLFNFQLDDQLISLQKA
ncbi:MAG: DUF2283 domain-containing protein [Ignavibacteriales bacterium]|nr:DUF2283 domain-containing protein [Ignavibacteriales bacterium]